MFLNITVPSFPWFFMFLFSHLVMSKSWRPYELEHTRLLCPPLSPGVCSNSCPFSQWSYLTISSSATPISFCLHSFPESGSFPMRWLFALGGQSIDVSATILPVNIQGWFPLGLTGLISLLFKGLSRVFSRPQFKSISSLALSLLYAPTLTWIHNYGKNQSFDYMDLCRQCNVCFLIHSLALWYLFYQGASVI